MPLQSDGTDVVAGPAAAVPSWQRRQRPGDVRVPQASLSRGRLFGGLQARGLQAQQVLVLQIMVEVTDV